MMTHSVYFWLSDEADAQAKLLKGCDILRDIAEIQDFLVGVPAETPARAVVDATYGVSLQLRFDSIADHNAYQVHALHDQFIAECAPFWSKVQIFDAAF